MNNVKPQKIEITTADINRGYKGIPEWRDALRCAENVKTPRRKKLHDLYAEVRRDMHLTSIISKRLMRVTNTRIKFFDANDKEVPELSALLDTEAAENMIKDILDSRFEGHSLIWLNGIADGKIDYTLVNRANVRPEEQQVVDKHSDTSGIDYSKPPYSNWCFECGTRRDLGLLAKAAPAVIYKKGDVADWATFAEIFGAPFREYIYNDTSVKAQFEAVAQNQQSAGYIIRPQNGEVKIHDKGNQSGSSDLYNSLAKFLDDQMSKLILLNTMTTDAQGGNYKGEVHQQSEEEVAKADKRFVIRILNEKFLKVAANFGYNVEGGHFAYEEADKMTPAQRLEMDIKFHAIKPLPDDYWYETYNRPKPSKEEIDRAQAAKQQAATKKDEAEKKKTELANESFLLKLRSLFSFTPWGQ